MITSPRPRTPHLFDRLMDLSLSQGQRLALTLVIALPLLPFSFGDATRLVSTRPLSMQGSVEAAPPVAALAASTAQVAGGMGRYVRSLDWELDFRIGPLRLYTDPNDSKTYWYFTYKVINRTGRERMWAPRFELFSDSGAIDVSGRQVASKVSHDVLALLGNPLLEDQNQVIGEILVGEEHAKEGLVIWPAKEADVTEFTVFVTGASGKVRKVPDPRGAAPRAEHWTIRFNYLVPGEALARGSAPVDPASTDEDLKDGAVRRSDNGVWIWR